MLSLAIALGICIFLPFTSLYGCEVVVSKFVVMMMIWVVIVISDHQSRVQYA